MKRFLIIPVFALIISCASTPSGPPPPQEFWFHPEKLIEIKSDEEHSRLKNIIFERENNECKVEMYKIPVPAASCTATDCSGLTGAALGFCQGYGPRCDYSGVHNAQNSRMDMMMACMGSKGYMLYTREKFILLYPEVIEKVSKFPSSSFYNPDSSE